MSYLHKQEDVKMCGLGRVSYEGACKGYQCLNSQFNNGLSQGW